MLPNRSSQRRIHGMEKAQIKKIGDYIKDLEEGLVEWDYDKTAMQTEWPYLCQIIKQLMDATFETKDKDLKVLLATLELKARKCKDCIERKMAVRN